jgi:hypothetical protein
MLRIARNDGPVLCSRASERRKSSFTIFVDWIFTASIERPFTTPFDAIAGTSAFACLCRTRNAG